MIKCAFGPAFNLYSHKTNELCCQASVDDAT